MENTGSRDSTKTGVGIWRRPEEKSSKKGMIIVYRDTE